MARLEKLEESGRRITGRRMARGFRLTASDAGQRRSRTEALGALVAVTGQLLAKVVAAEERLRRRR